MNLDKLSKKELLDLATSKKIPNRTKMKKEELIEALSPFYNTGSVKADKSKKDTAKKGAKEKDKVSSSDMNIGYMYQDSGPLKIKRDMPPIPDYYDQDTIAFMPVDPSREYVYWELSNHTLSEVRNKLNIQDTKIILKVFSRIENLVVEVASVPVERVGNWFFNIYAPLALLWSEVGVLDADGNFHSILVSNKVKMPADKVSDIIDQETWMTIGGDLDKLYQLSGLGLKDLGSSATMNVEIAKHIAQQISSSTNFIKSN